jgi:hypothetical protein
LITSAASKKDDPERVVKNKACTSCSAVLTVDNIAKCGKGTRRVCKKCWALYIRTYNEKPERREKIKKSNREYKQRDGGRPYKNAMLKVVYGLDLQGYDSMLVAQQGACAICKKPEKIKRSNGVTKALAVDHDHLTGRIRGLLCSACNLALGSLGDNPEIFEAAAKYLRAGGVVSGVNFEGSNRATVKEN